MRKTIISLVLALTLILGTGVLLAADLPSDAAPASEQVLRIGSNFEGQYLDVMKTMYNRIGRPELIQEPLTKFDQDFNVLPGAGAAKSWEVSEDGLTWTFHLQKDLVWSDDEPLTASDFEFAIKRAIEQGYDFGWYYSWAAGIKNWSKVESGDLPFSDLGLKALDDYTLQVTTNAPKSYLPAVFTWLYPVPEHAVKEYGDNYATKAETLVASGPFKVAEWVKGDKIVYVANPDYHGKWKPYLEKIVEVAGTGSAETAFPAYLAGELDTSPINPGQFMYVKQNITEQLYSWPSYQMFYLSMNTNDEPFTDPKVRKALALAIDRTKLTNTALRGLADPVTTLVMPGFPGHQTDLEDEMAFNPDRAKELLAEAGYPGGKGFPTIELLVRNEGPVMHIQKPLAQYIQNQYKTILGIDMKIRIVEMKTWSDQLVNRTHNFFLSPYAKDYLDPSNFMGLFTTSGREPYSNEEYDKLVNKANEVADWESRLELYKKAEKIFLDQAPGVPLVMRIDNQVWKPYLKGEAVEPNQAGIISGDGNIAQFWFTHIYIGNNK